MDEVWLCSRKEMEWCLVGKTYQLGIELTLDVIGGKWKPLILCHLGNGTLRTGELQKKIPAITYKMLTQQLKELESDQIIIRTVYKQVPPKVEYSLSQTGKTLKNILVEMSIWGEQRFEQLSKEDQETKLLIHNHDGFLNY